MLLTVLACSFLPENNLALPVGQKTEGLSETQYHQVIDKVAAKYRPILERMGKKLSINRLWENSRVNAGTLKKGDEVIINLYGGFARHQHTTEDGYTLVLCHELGHHLGGAPKKVSAGINWSSAEGQADYYATLKCLRKIFRHEDNEGIVAKLDVPSLVKEECTNSFPTSWERALCMRTTLAGISVSQVMADTSSDDLPDVSRPDYTLSSITFEEHPKTQCRLDTYFQGSICEVSSSRGLSFSDEAKGTCHPRHGHVKGLRPACWFKYSQID